MPGMGITHVGGTVYGGSYDDIEQFYLAHQIRETTFRGLNKTRHHIVIYLDPKKRETPPFPIYEIRIRNGKSVEDTVKEANEWIRQVFYNLPETKPPISKPIEGAT